MVRLGNYSEIGIYEHDAQTLFGAPALEQISQMELLHLQSEKHRAGRKIWGHLDSFSFVTVLEQTLI